MPDYASKLTKTAESVLDGERFVAAMKCFPQGYSRRKIKHSSLLGAAGAAKIAGERNDRPRPRRRAPARWSWRSV